MKNVSRLITIISIAFFFFSCAHIKVEINVPSGGILENAILIASDNGNAPREVRKLGDIDLSHMLVTFPQAIDTSIFKHWWLIGSIEGDVVFSSVLSLTDVDMYSIEPYTGAQLAWNIPANLESFTNGTGSSLDWWAQTINNHSSHVASNGSSATLWKFNNGSMLGSIDIELKHFD